MRVKRAEVEKATSMSAATSRSDTDEPITDSSPGAVRDLGAGCEPPVRVRGLVKHFGRFRALDGLDLTVEAGSVHGFLGPNGAGKSTTIRVLLGLYRPDGGSVSVLGSEPWRQAAVINRQVSYVPGDVALWPTLTGAQTLDALAALRSGRDRAREAELIEAFRSTLEEVAGADLVLHVVDAAHPDPLSQVAAVRTVLSEIPGALDVPELIVLNKTDLADAVTLAALRTGLPGAVAVSARTGEGIEELRARIEQMLPHPQVSIDVVVPYSRGDLVSRVHAEGEIDTVDYIEAGTHVVARVGAALAAEIEGAAAGAAVG